jgi:hypothetical protein
MSRRSRPDGRRVRAALLAPAIVLLAGLAGCGTGGSAERKEVSGIVTRFYSAIEADDGDRACDLLSQDTLEQLESQSEQTCHSVITRLDLHPAPVAASHVFITNAQVRLANDELAFLGREPEGWKLTAIGCQPGAGKPRNRPAECQVES